MLLATGSGALQKYEQAGQIHPEVRGLPEAVKRVREKLSAAGEGALVRARRFDEPGRWTEALKEYEKAVQWLPPDDPKREMAQSRVEQLKKVESCEARTRLSAPTNPEKIGRYQILERVGRGGMGVLLRGIDPVLDREVAIKLMLLDFTEDADQMRPRFYREARAAAKLQHPNIVTVFEFAEEGNTPYIVMEFLRGSSLQGRMASPVPLTLDEKLSVIIQLCSALHYAHEQGVVHRDIKPANIFLLPDGSVKLLDFGVAKLATSTLTRQGDVLGSAMYMSPEQVSGSGNVDGRSDIFSTGVVLYELLANRKPFQADTLTATVVKLLREDPPSLDEVAPGLPAQLVNAVKKALAKEPAARYATAGDMAKELQWIRQALQASDSGPARSTKHASRARRSSSS